MDTVDIMDSSKENILVYSAATFTRAFPDFRDGLKPIHRRILFTLYRDKTINLTKVATLCGRVLEFHPHGDSSVYGALVRMAQPWVMQYPYIDIQGNKGTQAGDPSAAGRYIMAKLSDFARYVILDELDPVVVDYSENYDRESMVPDYMPTKIPLVLINGVDGIGEAFRTKIPPHNLNDIADRCIMYIRNKNISNQEICDGLYPDFPTGGEILNGSELAEFYKNGTQTTIQIRGKAEFKQDTNTIVLVEFPYGIATDDISAAVTKEAKDGNMILSGIESIVDNNNNVDEDGNEITNPKAKKLTTYEYTCKKEANLVEVLNEISRVTNFKTSIPLSFMTTENGYPKYITVRDIITDWYKTRVDQKQRRHKNNIAKSTDKLHLYEGLLSVYDRIDDIINDIKKSTTNAEELTTLLAKKYNLTKTQARGIGDMPVRQLSGFGKVELQARIANIQNSIKDDEYVLSHIDQTIVSELENLKRMYGRPRKTTILMDEKIAATERPVITKGTFLYSLNEIGLYDSNGSRDSKSILTGMRPFKNVAGKNVKEIIGGTSVDTTPIAFAVCYSDATIQRVDSSVFRILNVWYDTKCDEKDPNRYITAACPIFSEDQELICISSDLKLKRISVSDLNKRAVGSGTSIVQIAPYNPKDNRIDYMIAGTTINKKGEHVPSYSIAPIEDIPLSSRVASGVKCAYELNEIDLSKGLYITSVDLDRDENTKIMIGAIDGKDSQNYIYSIPISELSMTGRTNKPKSLALPAGYEVTSLSYVSVDNKDQVLCMIGKNSSSTLSVTNFKKPFTLKKVFLTVTTSTVL